MNEPFLLEVTWQNKQLEFPAAFQRYGYTYRIVVSINDVNYIFEPDEEGSYRVLNTDNCQTLPEVTLLQAIARTLQKLQ